MWRDPNTGEEILAMEHPGEWAAAVNAARARCETRFLRPCAGGYGGITRTDCVETVSGVALCFAFRERSFVRAAHCGLAHGARRN